MALLTIDRFLAITYTLHYPRLMTLKRSKVIILLVWTLIITLYSALFCLSSKQSDNTKQFQCLRHHNIRNIFISISGVSLGTILTLYAYILKVARRQARLIAAQNIIGNIEGRQNILLVKIYISVLSITNSI